MTGKRTRGATGRKRKRPGTGKTRPVAGPQGHGPRADSPHPAALAYLLRAVQDNPGASHLRPLLARQAQALQATHGNQHVQDLFRTIGSEPDRGAKEPDTRGASRVQRLVDETSFSSWSWKIAMKAFKKAKGKKTEGPKSGVATPFMGLEQRGLSYKDSVTKADLLARTWARTAVSRVDQAMGGNNEQRSRFQIWFGPWDDARARTVHDNLGLILGGLNEKIVYKMALRETFRHPGTFAYIKNGQPGIVFLAKQFFQSGEDATVTDSTAGTLIHELSHVKADTDDIQYGQAGCRQLAQNDPNAAIRNADNYQYFCESGR